MIPEYKKHNQLALTSFADNGKRKWNARGFPVNDDVTASHRPLRYVWGRKMSLDAAQHTSCIELLVTEAGGHACSWGMLRFLFRSQNQAHLDRTLSPVSSLCRLSLLFFFPPFLFSEFLYFIRNLRKVFHLWEEFAPRLVVIAVTMSLWTSGLPAGWTSSVISIVSLLLLF